MVVSLPLNFSKSGWEEEKSRNTIGRTSDVGATPTSTQLNPGSIVQVGEQPSPALVLPSSHASVPFGSLMPSPHDDVHAPCVQSGSFTQKGVQPSPRSLLPSSH